MFFDGDAGREVCRMNLKRCAEAEGGEPLATASHVSAQSAVACKGVS